MQGKNLLSTATIFAIAAFSFITPAYAIMSVPDGWYLEANGGWAHESGKSYSPGSSSMSSGAGNGSLGYKFMPYFGLEAGYTYYSQTTIKTNGNKAGFDKRYAIDLAAKGIVPISDTGFELFAKVGASRVSSQVTIKNAAAAASIGLAPNSHNRTGVYLGLGGQYYVMPELAIVVQWQRAQGNSQTGTFDLYSAGLSFIFS